MEQLIQVACSRLNHTNGQPEDENGDVKSDSETCISKLDCIGIICIDEDSFSTSESRAMMGPVGRDKLRIAFWEDFGVSIYCIHKNYLAVTYQ